LNLFPPPGPFLFSRFLDFSFFTQLSCVFSSLAFFPLFRADLCDDGCTFFRDDGDDNDEDVDSCTEKNTSRDDARVFLFSLFFIVVVDVATAVASVLSSYQQERVFKARATF
jgi:hypothetical protein